MPDKFHLFDGDFITAAVHRALRTLAQAAVALIGTATVIEDVRWTTVASGALLAAVLSVLTSIATDLPEVDTNSKEA